MVLIIDPSILSALAGTGGAIFMLGFGLLVQKAKEEIKNSYLIHYFTPILLLGLGATLFFMAVSLK